MTIKNVLTLRIAKSKIKKAIGRDNEGEEASEYPRLIRLYLSGYTHIEDDASRAIGDAVDGICLPDVETISPIAVQHLAQRADELRLDGLTTLPDGVARALAKFQGAVSFNGLTQISELDAHHLASIDVFSEFDRLHLEGLVELSEPVAKALSRYPGFLVLDGVRRMSPSVAMHLSLGRNHYLSLGSLNDFSGSEGNEVAHWLGRATNSLSLVGITNLPASIAKHFSEGGGPLYLDGLDEEISDESARLLAQRPGKLTLVGMKRMRESTAQILSSKRNWLILGLEELTKEIAEQFAKHKGGLRFYSLTHLDDYAAEALSKHEGPMGFTALRRLSAKAAKHLSECPGELMLDLDLLPSRVREILAQRVSVSRESL
jgi:hypothetical protein